MTQALRGRPEVTSLAIEGGPPVTKAMVPPVCVEITEPDIEAAVGVLRSGMLAAGAKSKAFEERWAAFTGAKHAMTCANGTCALQLAYEPLIQPGDHVLVPAWSYIATVSMVVARGAVPVFVDADPETYQIDAEDAKAKASTRTTAIAATHLYGTPVDVGAIEALSAQRGLSVIYDAAQAHGARWQGRPLGEFGDAVTYSFYATKNITTGEGGMVTTNDEALAKSIRMLRSHGEAEKYIHTQVGFNYRMTDLEAAIGLSQLERVERVTARRIEIASTYAEALEDIPGLFAPHITDGATGVHHLFPVRVEPRAFAPVEGGPGAIRDLIVEAMRAEGVAVAIHYPRALTQQPAFASLVRASCPVAERLASTLFCIPVHHRLSEAQVQQVVEALRKVGHALRA